MPNPAKAYSARMMKDYIYIMDARTGLGLFPINLRQARGAPIQVIGFFISGETATLSYQDGVTQVWDLRLQSMLRSG